MYFCRKNYSTMCTYRITIDDTLLEKAKDAFANEAEISSWMQAQLEILLLQIAERIKPQKRQKESISKKLRGIAKAPDSFDYKEELGK